MDYRFQHPVQIVEDLFKAQFKPLAADWGSGRIQEEYYRRPGKALRPILFLSSFITFAEEHKGEKQYYGEEAILWITKSPLIWEIANALERLHLGIMAVDDHFDGAQERRGGKSLPVIFADSESGKVYEDSRENTYTFSPVVMTVNGLVWNIIEVWERILWVTGLPFADCNNLGRYLSIPQKPFAYDVHPDKAYIFNHLQRVVSELRDRITNDTRSLRYDLQQDYITALQETLNGEKEDVALSQQETVPTLEQVFAIQMAKTTWYSISLPLRMGYLLANSGHPDPAILAQLDIVSQYYGQAFQIIDDKLVVVPPEKAGKDTRADLVNGSMTTVLVLTDRLMKSDQERQEWRHLLAECQTSSAACDQAVGIIKVSGALEESDRLIAGCIARCNRAMKQLKHLGYDPCLLRYIIQKGLSWMDDDRIKA